jgi:predicted dithiol-disulfide oxidoreductase (DUF899 family)
LPEVVSREEWLAARREFRAKEKEVTRARVRLNADRRRLPMVRMDKAYTFEGPHATVGLLDLFEGRPQRVVRHFMFGRHSSYGGGFNYDFHATLDDRVEPVLLHFRTEAERAEAGIEEFHNGYHYLDLTALGRQEAGVSPRRTP